MQAVILAAGRGTRMKALTDTMPKPMLSVCGKNLIEHKLDILPEEVTECVLVVGYKDAVIREHFGEWYQNKHRKIPLRYVTQKKLNGTAGALHAARFVLKNRFLVMMGDDIYTQEDSEKLLETEWGIVVKRIEQKNGDVFSGGNIICDEAGMLNRIAEGTHDDAVIRCNTGLYMLDTRIFNYSPVQLQGKDEWGLPQTMVMAKDDLPITIVETTHWLQMTSPEDLARAEKILGCIPETV